MRIAEAKQKAEARAAMIDISIIGGLLLGIFTIVMVVTSVAVE
jgi:hypothetical protein